MNDPIQVRSEYEPRTESPLVVFQWGQIQGDMTPNMAREFAMQILACAGAAEQDAFLTQFLTNQAGVDMDHALKALAEFGRWRNNNA